ncbi:Ribosome biogenesis regulatory protein [Orchesella cincta]|uniref:Ribosome biogenesis regulatory protein n=1 Tax=Orchesella cincta TaxID=48709 RepID=A0A1D2MN34_ORCCI|nr:Ribosome biogenesis regulatory protein [Orchesella cincta]
MEVESSSSDEPRSIAVEKAIEVDIDPGNLLVSDSNEISRLQLNSNPAEYLKELTRSNTQLLINRIFTLPFHRVDDVIVAELPKPTYVLPRSKPAPKARPLSKWESYAKEKGIVKKKKSRLVWDEMVKKWVPRFGYRRAEAEHAKDWLIEVPQHADPYEDQFEKKSEEKSERVAKNELQRLRNLAKAKKVVVPAAKGLTSKVKQSKEELLTAAHTANKATASLGKFQPKVGKLKPLKGTGKKRQFEPLINNQEKAKNLSVLDKIMNKKPKIDVESVVSKSVGSGNLKRKGQGQDNYGDDEDGGQRRGGRRGKQMGTKNSKIKKGPAKKGSFKKGRASPRSGPKKKKN